MTDLTNQIIEVPADVFENLVLPNRNSSTQTFAIIVLATLLFFALSPGMILTLPQNSTTQCSNDLAISDCGSSGPQCTKCSRLWASEFMNVGAVFVHALIFALVLFLLSIWFIR